MEKSLQKQIHNFFIQPSSKPKVIVVYGPTACGKTRLSIEIARELDTEIISADSRQIYRMMDIGTGKISETEKQGIPHHMINIIDPDEAFSVVNYREQAAMHLDKLWKAGKIPIICGGTGLYIDSLIFERSYPSIPADWDMRNELENFRIQHGNEALWERLHAIDPIYANTLHPNDRQYIIRGIEVYTKSGRSKMEQQDIPSLKYDTLFLTPYDGDREKLYEKINFRVKEMFENGLVEEMEYIMDNLSRRSGRSRDDLHCPGLATIGYAELWDLLDKKISLEDCQRLVAQHNRNYAKRQITWNKKYGN